MASVLSRVYRGFDKKREIISEMDFFQFVGRCTVVLGTVIFFALILSTFFSNFQLFFLQKLPSTFSLTHDEVITQVTNKHSVPNAALPTQIIKYPRFK